MVGNGILYDVKVVVVIILLCDLMGILVFSKRWIMKFSFVVKY